MNMSNVYLRIVAGALLSMGLLLILFIAPWWVFHGIILAMGVYAAGVELPRLVQSRSHYAMLAVTYIAFPLGLLVWFDLRVPRGVVVMPFFLVALFDSASYMAGKLWGKHAIAPSISPGKTWEGFFGGLIAVCAAVFFIISYESISLPYWQIVVFCALFSIIALSGDLFESYLKRKAGLKDSGSLIPGHGGLLDRIDALLFILPYYIACYYLYLK